MNKSRFPDRTITLTQRRNVHDPSYPSMSDDGGPPYVHDSWEDALDYVVARARIYGNLKRGAHADWITLNHLQSRIRGLTQQKTTEAIIQLVKDGRLKMRAKPNPIRPRFFLRAVGPDQANGIGAEVA